MKTNLPEYQNLAPMVEEAAEKLERNEVRSNKFGMYASATLIGTAAVLGSAWNVTGSEVKDIALAMCVAAPLVPISYLIGDIMATRDKIYATMFKNALKRDIESSDYTPDQKASLEAKLE